MGFESKGSSVGKEVNETPNVFNVINNVAASAGRPGYEA
jgi:hypothetical protein